MLKYAKAIVGLTAAVVGALNLGLEDNVLTLREWLRALEAGLLALAVVWGVPNKGYHFEPESELST